jgi:hypothetical protein
MTDTSTRGRKLLKQHGKVQLSQETVAAPAGRQVFRYFVGLADGPVKVFDTPHRAWAYFQELTGEERPGD